MLSIPSFDPMHLQRICDVLGDTSKGLTGTEIGQLLRSREIEDPMVGATKQDALDLLTIASFLHRRLDETVRMPRKL